MMMAIVTCGRKLLPPVLEYGVLSWQTSDVSVRTENRNKYGSTAIAHAIQDPPCACIMPADSLDRLLAIKD